VITFVAQLKTKNLLNLAHGISRNAMFARARVKKSQRTLMAMLTKANVRNPEFPLKVTITRIAPSNGLDPHDGLGAALKGCIDGIADGLGLKNDRDVRVEWVLRQTRGKPREYAVRVDVEPGTDWEDLPF